MPGDAHCGRHRRRRLSRLPSLRVPARPRPPRHLRRQPRDRARSRNIDHIRGDEFLFLNHDVTEHLEIDEPVDFVYHFAALASPVDYLRHAAALAEGRLVRDAQRARAREVQARPVPARLDERGLRRPAGAPAAGDLLGPRQPDRPARRLRRGEALRRGADDGVPRPAGRGHRRSSGSSTPTARACARTTAARSRPSSARRSRASR